MSQENPGETPRFQGQTIGAFMEELSSKAPVPGGGACAALCAAVSVCLSAMVASLTVGKKKYADVRPQMDRLLEEAHDLKEKLLDLMDRDAEAFRSLSLAYRLPKGTEEEKGVRDQVMEEALERAASSPLEILETAVDALNLAFIAKVMGASIALSDAGCAAAVLEGAMKAAALNVSVNTRLMKNRDKADRMDARVRDLLARGLPQAEQIYREVGQSLAGPA